MPPLESPPPIEAGSASLRTIETAIATGADVPSLLQALRTAHALIVRTNTELQESKKLAAKLDAELVDLAARSRALKSKDRSVLTDLEKRALDVVDSAEVLAKTYVFFCSPYTGPHLFGVGSKEPGWDRSNVSVRYDKKFEENRRLGDYLDLLHCCLNETTKSQVRQGYSALVNQFVQRAEDERSNLVHRGRADATLVFSSIQDKISEDLAELEAKESLPTWTPNGANSDEVKYVLKEFGKELFSSACAPCRQHLRRLCEVAGIIHDQTAGEFMSEPFCGIMYRFFDTSINEDAFRNPVLYKMGRLLLYGPSFVNRSDKLVINKKNPLSKIENLSGVTPGFIALTAILVRIILSPDPSFTRDGQGPTTKIQWNDDFDEYTKSLWGVWNTPSGRTMVSEWNRNVFPSISQQYHARASIPARHQAPPRTQGSTADDMIAAAQMAQPQPQQRVVPACARSYHLPTSRDLNADSFSMPEDHAATRIHEESSRNDDVDFDASQDSVSYQWDESAGNIFEIPPQAHSSVVRHSSMTSNTPVSIQRPEQLDHGLSDSMRSMYISRSWSQQMPDRRGPPPPPPPAHTRPVAQAADSQPPPLPPAHTRPTVLTREDAASSAHGLSSSDTRALNLPPTVVAECDKQVPTTAAAVIRAKPAPRRRNADTEVIAAHQSEMPVPRARRSARAATPLVPAALVGGQTSTHEGSENRVSVDEGLEGLQGPDQQAPGTTRARASRRGGRGSKKAI